MYRVCKEIYFCYGHRLLHYQGPCMHPHGHNAKAEVYLRGETLDERDLLYDFGEVKEVIKGWIDQTIDHKMLLNKQDPLVLPFRELKEPMVLFETDPTVEAIAKMIYEYAEAKKMPVDEVRVWETESAWASYSLARVKPDAR